VPFIEAVNCCVPKPGTVAELGATITEPAALAVVIVTLPEPDFVLSACEVAVTMICAGFGTVGGAA
jgi:hypothetical protein